MQPGLRIGVGGGARKHCDPADGGHPSLDWREQSCRGTVGADHAARLQESANVQLGWPEKLTSPHDPRHALQRNGGLDGPVSACATQSWCCLFLQDVDVANARVGAERNPLKTEVIYNVNDLEAPPERKIGDFPSLAQTCAVTDGSITLGIAVGSRQFIADQLLSKADVIRATHDRVQLCEDLQTEFALLRESLGVSRIIHILRVHDHTVLEEESAAAVHDEIGQRTSQPRLIWEPSSQPGFLPEQLLETRLSEVIETATSTYLSALDNDEQATAWLFIQKAAQAADESWQHTVSGKQGPRVAGPTTASLGHPGSASQKHDSDDTGRADSVEVLCTTPHIYEQKTAQTMATSLTCLSTTR